MVVHTGILHGNQEMFTRIMMDIITLKQYLQSQNR